jgi:hypothetical protein
MSDRQRALARRCAEVVQETAQRLLRLDPDPIPRYLLLRELGRGSETVLELREARNDLFRSRWVQQLQETQWADGTWGRFHSRDTSARQAIPTTEHGITLALAYGLNGEDALLARTARFIEEHLEGKTESRDRVEKHGDPRAWPVITRFISAANLALIDDGHERLAYFADVWAQIATAAFKGGAYDRLAEIAAFNALLQLSLKRPPALQTKYALILLSSARAAIDGHLERAILAHTMARPDGVSYLYGQKLAEMPRVDERGFYLWLATQMVLSRFTGWFRFAEAFVTGILDQAAGDGLWHFSEKTARRPNSPLPLSENWRREANKGVDCSVLILRLLSRYAQQAEG